MLNNNLPFDGFVRRENHILSTIYTLNWTCEYSVLDNYIVETNHFDFGRLKNFYSSYKEHFPKIISFDYKENPDITFDKAGKIKNKDILRIETHLLCLPSNDVIVIDTIHFKSSIEDAILIMEDFYYHKILIDSNPLYDYHENLSNSNIEIKGGYGFTYHQIFTIAKKYISKDIDPDLVQKIVYRADLDCRENYSTIDYPKELNRRPNTFCGVGSYVTVNGGHQGYIENCIILSAVSIVGSLERMKYIRSEIRDILNFLHNDSNFISDYKNLRKQINIMNKEAIRLKLEISLYVQFLYNIGLLVPALRVSNYHESLIEANNIRSITNITSSMLNDLEKIISYEINRLGFQQTSRDEAHKRMWTVIISIISVISIPPSIILAFLSSGVQEVGVEHPSMFDMKSYGGLYATIFISILLAIAVGFIVRLLSTKKED